MALRDLSSHAVRRDSKSYSMPWATRPTTPLCISAQGEVPFSLCRGMTGDASKIFWYSASLNLSPPIVYSVSDGLQAKAGHSASTHKFL